MGCTKSPYNWKFGAMQMVPNFTNIIEIFGSSHATFMYFELLFATQSTNRRTQFKLGTVDEIKRMHMYNGIIVRCIVGMR